MTFFLNKSDDSKQDEKIKIKTRLREKVLQHEKTHLTLGINDN